MPERGDESPAIPLGRDRFNLVTPSNYPGRRDTFSWR
jgi:hypothetical protein